jgi:hypothetical protein
MRGRLLRFGVFAELTARSIARANSAREIARAQLVQCLSECRVKREQTEQERHHSGEKQHRGPPNHPILQLIGFLRLLPGSF